MRRWLNHTFDVRRGERLRAGLMMAYGFLLISAIMVAKPVSSGMFLAVFGAHRLPHVFILVAVIAALVTQHYARFLKKYDLFPLIRNTLLVNVAMLPGFWLMLRNAEFMGWALFLFFIWVAVTALVASSQFWILADTIFNPREAKRLFGLIGAGAIAGGIFGGYLTKFLAPHWGSTNLLWISAAALAFCLPLVELLRRETRMDENLLRIRKRMQVDALTPGPVHMILRSRHLMLVSGIVGMSVLAGKLVEYQFSAIASDAIAETDQLTAFFGVWLSNLNIASFLIQVFVTRHVVGRFGVGAALFLMPFAVFMGALAVLIHPALWSAILIKLCDGSLKNSVNKASLELLILPVPSEVKGQTKLFIDVFVDSLATGIGGFLLLALTVGAAVSPAGISVVIFGVVAVWGAMVVSARREYIRTYRLNLTEETPAEIDAQDEEADVSLICRLTQPLEGEDLEQLIKTLRLSREVRHSRLLPCYTRLIRHPHATVRLEVLKNAYFYPTADFMEEAEQLVTDPDPAVRTEAIHYLFQHSGGDRYDRLMGFLEDADYRLRGAALLCAAREGRRNRKLRRMLNLRGMVTTQLQGMAGITDPEQVAFTKISLARVIGAANMPDLYPYLHLFLNDVSRKVVTAAAEAAGETRDLSFVPVLIRRIRNPAVARSVAAALVEFGPDVVAVLAEYLDNPLVDARIRLRIPWVLSHIGTQKSVDTLIAHVHHSDLNLRYEIIRALNRLRLAKTSLRFDDRRIVMGILEESRNHLGMLTALDYQTGIEADGADSPDLRNAIARSRRQLIRVLEKRLDDNLERIFRLMGLRYPPQDIYRAYRHLRSKKMELRADAVEFLDNLLEMNVKKMVIPIVESAVFEGVVAQTLQNLGFKAMSEKEAMAILLATGDSRLQYRVLDLISKRGQADYLPLVAPMVNSPDERVSGLARSILNAAGFAVENPGATGYLDRMRSI